MEATWNQVFHRNVWKLPWNRLEGAQSQRRCIAWLREPSAAMPWSVTKTVSSTSCQGERLMATKFRGTKWFLLAYSKKHDSKWYSYTLLVSRLTPKTVVSLWLPVRKHYKKGLFSTTWLRITSFCAIVKCLDFRPYDYSESDIPFATHLTSQRFPQQ